MLWRGQRFQQKHPQMWHEVSRDAVIRIIEKYFHAFRFFDLATAIWSPFATPIDRAKSPSAAYAIREPGSHLQRLRTIPHSPEMSISLRSIDCPASDIVLGTVRGR